MPLTSDEISALVGELAPLVEGAIVEGVHQRDEHTLVITVYSPGVGKRYLLFSTRPRLTRFHLVEERPPALPEPPPFSEAARKRLKGARWAGIRQISGDRVIELAFRRSGDGDSLESAFIVQELIGGRGQLVLLDGSRRLVASLHPCRRGPKEVAVGEIYRFPRPKAQHPQLKALAQTPWRYLGPADGGTEAESTLHLVLARRYATIEEAEILVEKKEALRVQLARGAAAREGALRKIREDLARLEAGEEHLRAGELLKGAFGRLRRGMSSVEVENYFDPALPTLEIRLDPALGPQQNIERYFKRYQKCRRGAPILRERLHKLEAEHDRANELLESLQEARTLGDVAIIEEKARPLRRMRSAARAKGPAAAVPLGPRRFISRDGLEILVGRSAKQNDELTLRIARGNDVFLHVAGKPGSHVVVRSSPGKQAPLETLLDAAQLAIYYSLPERQRGEIGDGIAAEVDYTPIKHVRKPRGAKPGLVLLATHKTLRARLDLERIRQLKDSVAESGEAGGGAREN